MTRYTTATVFISQKAWSVSCFGRKISDFFHKILLTFKTDLNSKLEMWKGKSKKNARIWREFSMKNERKSILVLN